MTEMLLERRLTAVLASISCSSIPCKLFCTCVSHIIFHSLPTVPVIAKLRIFVTVQGANDIANRLSKKSYVLRIILQSMNWLLCSKIVLKKNCRPPFRRQRNDETAKWSEKITDFREQNLSTVSLYHSILGLCVATTCETTFSPC